MRSSLKIFLIAGSLFALVGFLFVIIFFVITANLDEVMRHARGDAWLIQPMFGILGFMCLIIKMRRKTPAFRRGECQVDAESILPNSVWH